jgi:hypothetical protein
MEKGDERNQERNNPYFYFEARFPIERPETVIPGKRSRTF